MSKKARVTLVCIVAAIIVLVAAGWWMLAHGMLSSHDEVAKTSNNVPTLSDKAIARMSLYDKAQKAAAEESPAAGQAILDQELQKATDKEAKAEIYSAKSQLASSVAGGGDQAQALQYAYDAEAASPDYGTALTVAWLEEQAGNVSTAIKYYNFYLDRMTDEAKNLNPGDYEFYAAHVKELEAR